MRQSNPKVGVGVPVRNGGQVFVDAIESIVNQTYRNIEIIISDNASDDETESICREYAKKDSRIKYFRQSTNIGVENFRFVYEQSDAEYFMWAAHDDRRSINYIEKLLEALVINNKCSLAYGDVAVFHEFDKWRDASCACYTIDEYSDGFWRGLDKRSYISSGYLHIYGLIKKSALEGFTWPKIEISADRVFLLYLWCRGGFVKAQGTCFYCWKPMKKKNPRLRAKESGLPLKPFPYIRLSYVCAQAAKRATLLEGVNRSFIIIFTVLVYGEIRKKYYRIIRYIGGRCLRVIEKLKK